MHQHIPSLPNNPRPSKLDLRETPTSLVFLLDILNPLTQPLSKTSTQRTRTHARTHRELAGREGVESFDRALETGNFGLNSLPSPYSPGRRRVQLKQVCRPVCPPPPKPGEQPQHTSTHVKSGGKLAGALSPHPTLTSSAASSDERPRSPAASRWCIMFAAADCLARSGSACACAQKVSCPAGTALSPVTCALHCLRHVVPSDHEHIAFDYRLTLCRNPLVIPT